MEVVRIILTILFILVCIALTALVIFAFNRWIDIANNVTAALPIGCICYLIVMLISCIPAGSSPVHLESELKDGILTIKVFHEPEIKINEINVHKYEK